MAEETERTGGMRVAETRGRTDLKPPSGTRDFLPDELARREEAFRRVREVFERHGFQPTQTPAFERLEILSGKYGEDEKLIFKIQRRGERADEGADLALRYDQTVPLARVVARYRDRLPRIFRRYQIGPVWRADRPGKGRFREFYQCDVDVVGARPPLADAEVVLVLTEALAALGLGDFEVRLNSRRVLSGLLEAAGVPEALRTEALVAIDKLDKVGPGGVEAELEARGIPGAAVRTLGPLLAGAAAAGGAGEAAADAAEDADAAAALLRATAAGREGLEAVAAIRDLAQPLLKAGRIRFAPTLARGLNYYTGMIFEIYAAGFPGAVAAGGRYDNLLGMFTKEGLPACGGSIGIERVLEVLAGREAPRPAPPAEVLMTVWDEASRLDALRLAAAIREKGVAVETYLGSERLGRQIGYAAERGIPFAVVRGPDERAAGLAAVKDLAAGVQESLPEGDLPAHLARRLGRSTIRQPSPPRVVHNGSKEEGRERP